MGKSPPFAVITVVGAGGTGCALLPLLAGLPISDLAVIDGDTVEVVNLPRQPLYGPGDIGRMKVEVAAMRIQHQAPQVRLHPVPHFMDGANAEALLAGSTLVADCTDDLHVRRLIDRTCGAHRIPLVTGSVHGHQVQVATLHVPREGDGLVVDLDAFFPGRIGAEQDGCDMRQVPAHVTAFAAAVMAQHIGALLSGDHSRAGQLDVIDVRHGHWMTFEAPVVPYDDELIARAAERSTPA